MLYFIKPKKEKRFWSMMTTSRKSFASWKARVIARPIWIIRQHWTIKSQMISGFLYITLYKFNV